MSIVCVIPVYNEPTERLLASLNSAGECDRIIVVDDGSLVPVIVPGSKAEVVRKENGGSASALNAGIERADSDAWIVRLDCGDTTLGNKAEQIQAAIDANMEASFSPSHDVVNDQPFTISDNWRTRIWTDNQFAASTTVFRRSVWQEVGGYNESLKWCDDWDFAAKVQAHCGWHHFPEVTAKVGCFPGGMTDQAREAPQAYHRDRIIVGRRARALGGRA